MGPFETEMREEFMRSLKSSPLALRAMTEGPQPADAVEIMMPVINALMETVFRIAREIDERGPNA